MGAEGEARDGEAGRGQGEQTSRGRTKKITKLRKATFSAVVIGHLAFQVRMQNEELKERNRRLTAHVSEQVCEKKRQVFWPCFEGAPIASLSMRRRNLLF